MRKVFLSMMMLLSVSLMLAAEVDVTVTLVEAGTLREKLSDYDQVDRLSVRGKFNSVDLKYLREHTGRLMDLYYLDLSDIEIEESAEPYYSYSESTGAIGSYTYYQFYLSATEREELSSSGGLHPEGTHHIFSASFAYAFSECSNLREVRLPKSMGKRVGRNLFRACTNLEAVALPEGCDSIGREAFYGCRALKEMSNTAMVSRVGAYAFSQTSDLKPLMAPLSFVGDYAFSESGIDSVRFASDLQEIGKYAFGNCYNLKSVEIPGNVVRIGAGAFYECFGLQSIVVGEGTRYLDSYCFYQCSEVQTISLPSTIIGVGRDALTGVPMDFFLEDGVQYVGKVAYKLIDTELADVVIREGTVSIADNFSCFQYLNTTIRSLSLPSSLRGIGNHAFWGASQLKTVNLPEGLEEIGEFAFSETRVGSIVIPSTVEMVRSEAFSRCRGLIRVSWNAVDATVEDNVFMFCSAIEQVVFGEGVKRVPDCVFGVGANNSVGSDNLYGLMSVTLSSTIEEIGENAFSYCTALQTINWPKNSSLKTIGNGAFYYTLALEEFVFPEGVETLGGSMFGTGSELSSKQIALRSVMIPASVKSIGESFVTSGSKNLKEIVCFIENPDKLGDKTFFDIGGMQITLRVPYGTKGKYEALPNWNLTTRNMTTKIVELGTPSATKPVTTDTTADLTKLAGEDLWNTMIDGVYYALDSDHGDGYDATEECLVLNSAMTEEQIVAASQDNVSDQELVTSFQGIILQLAAGEGEIELDGETLGNRRLMVKIGSGEPVAVELPSRGIAKVAYNLSAHALVYIYTAASESSTARRVAAENCVKLYGMKVKVTSSQDAVASVTSAESPKEVYDLQGRKVESEAASLQGIAKGVYIIGGKKIIVW